MAHEIDQTTGKAAVFVTGEPAWHRLGTVIEQAASSAEAIMLAGLDWQVAQWPVRAFNPSDGPNNDPTPPKRPGGAGRGGRGKRLAPVTVGAGAPGPCFRQGKYANCPRTGSLSLLPATNPFSPTNSAITAIRHLRHA